MPYTVRKSGKKYKVVNKNTGKVYGTHDSKEKANKQLAALHIHTGESKFILRQDTITESNGVITVIPEGSMIIVDRYSALGIERPDPETMCKGSCEGTGYVPIYNIEMCGENDCHPADSKPLIGIDLELWNNAEQENPTDDGWHFVKCPDCKGAGKMKEDIWYDETAPLCPICNNRLMQTRGIGYTHACALPVEQGENHTITVANGKAVLWDGTRDHYSRLNNMVGINEVDPVLRAEKIREAKVTLREKGMTFLSPGEMLSETIMDKAFDEFNERFTPITKDGYYEIDTIIDDFVCYLVENFNWYITRHGKNRGDMLPSYKEYVWLVNKAYPSDKLVITDIGNGKIKVEEKKL